MKLKKVIPFVIGMLLLSLICIPAVAKVVNPNYGSVKQVTHYVEDNYWTCKGYVQCQPSYYDHVYGHAQAGSMYFQSKIGTTVVDTYGPVNTAAGTCEGDNRILSRTYTYTSITGATGVGFAYDFVWQPHTGDPTTPWTYPFGFQGNTE